MPRKSKKQQAQQPEQKGYEEFADENEAGDDDVAVDDAARAAALKMRDWRDVEKYKEERRLRNLIDDDLDFDLPTGKVPAFPELKRKR